MAYITYEQYTQLYGTPPITEAEFLMYATTASDIIDSITQYRIERAGGISALPAGLQTLVQKAAAAQVLYLAQNGLETVVSGQTGQGFTVGKVSVDGAGASAGGMTAAQLIVCPMAKMYLEQTRLMERSAPCFDQFRPGFYGIL